jgi:hypothetical protein
MATNRNESIDVLLVQHKRLSAAIEQERGEIEVLQEVLGELSEQCRRHEYLLGQVESVLGRSPQIQLEHATLPLRGQRISEVAIEVLADEKGEGAEVHYTEWFEMLRRRGHFVVGKDPVNTFLTEINRSPHVRRVGARTGLYYLPASA